MGYFPSRDAARVRVPDSAKGRCYGGGHDRVQDSHNQCVTGSNSKKRDRSSPSFISQASAIKRNKSLLPGSPASVGSGAVTSPLAQENSPPIQPGA